jgi:hypothetical protein
MMLGVILLVGGVAAPKLKEASRFLPGGDGASVAGRLSHIQDEARAITTRQRMMGIKATLRMWSAQHGPPDANDLEEAVGRDTATDEWGRLIRLVPPTANSAGCLRSLGPDGKPSRDDIIVPLTWHDVNRTRMVPGWQ